MSSMKRKVWALVLSAMIALPLFTGCGKNEKGAGADQQQAQTSSPVQAKDEKKPVLKYLGSYQAQDPNTYAVAKVLEERTGYKVQYDMLPQDKPDDKLNIIFASAEDYDVIKMYNKLLYAELARRGALTQLDPLIDKSGNNIKTAISKQTSAPLTVENKLYAIGNRMAVDDIAYSLMVRQDWLDKLGLKAPQTLDDYVNVLKAFKEKDPGGNGAKNIPFVTETPIIGGFTGAFGIANGWNEADGKLVPRPLDPGFKEYLTFMSNLYKEGLLDKELPVNKSATVREKFTSGRAGMMVDAYWNMNIDIDPLNKNFPEAKISVLTPPVGKDGKVGYAQRAGLDGFAVIPTASKNKEHALKWLDAKLEKDTFKLYTIGEEGKHWRVANGEMEPINPTFFDEKNFTIYYLTGQDEANYPTYWKQTRNKKDMRNYGAFNEMQKGIGKWNKIDLLAWSPALPTYAKSSQELDQMVTDFMTKVIAGGEPLSSLDAFVQKWKAAGGDASIKEVNDWYAGTRK